MMRNVTPVVKIMDAEQCNGNEKDEHQGQGDHDRFSNPSNNNAPDRAGEMVHENEKQSAKTDDRPESKTDQIRMEKLLRIYKITNRAENQSNDSNSQKAVSDGA